jgi:tight adherence protein B
MLSAEMVPMISALLAAAAVVAIALVLLAPLMSGTSPEEERRRNVTETRAMKAASRTASETTATRRKAVSESLKDIENRQKAVKKVTLQVRLQRAGMKASPRTFWLWSAVSGTVLGLVSFLSLPGSSLTFILVPLAIFVGAFGLPRFWLNRCIKKRQFKFTAELANSVDLIVRGIKAGLPLNECLQIIARESPEPIASEFKEVVDQQRVGVPLAETLDRLSMRMPTAEVRFFAIVIAIQQQAGGNLSEALSNLSGVLRDRAKLALKVQAMSSEAKAGAMVLGSMPPAVTLMISFASPKYLLPLFQSTMGHFILLAAGLWMLLGILSMKKMINFKY